MNVSNGLKFKKFDLHLHTPASDDYEDKSITPEAIVDTAIGAGLSGIAITDHQTGEWIDKIKEAAKGKPLVVFPGLELKVGGGKDGIHIIIIFNIDKTSEYVKSFLNKIGVYQYGSKIATIADKTLVQIAQELQNYDKDAILVLAHCDSTFGVNSDMRGEQRSNVFKPELFCLLGAEDNETNFIDQTKIEKHTRIIDLCDGGYELFHNKRLGVYQSSDSHKLTDIGKQFTYFKVDDFVTIEDIRQSLIDRETRIRQSFEYSNRDYPRIVSLRATSGFLADEKFEFHGGLNSILGAKGSGKSLAIEFLRFGLNQESENEEIQGDHITKLDRCLKIHGEIEISLIDDSGKGYIIKRVYNPAENHPLIVSDSFGIQKFFQIEQFFPVLFLSQNEIIKIAEDKTGASQRKFIDQFFDFHKYQQEIDKFNLDLHDIDCKFSEVLKAHLSVLIIQQKISTHVEEIGKLSRQIKNSVFEEYIKKENIGQALQIQENFILSYRELLVNSENEYRDIVAPQSEDPLISANPSVKRSVDLVNTIIKKTHDNILDAIKYLDIQIKFIKQELIDWQTSFNPIKERYDSVVVEAGGNQVALDQKRKKLTIDLSKLEKELAQHQGKAQQIKNVAKQRDEIIQKIDDSYKSYFEERLNRCQYFTDNSAGALEVAIREREDKTAFRDNLLKLKRGSWLKDDEIESISERISPRDFIDSLLRYEWSARANNDPIKNISDKTGIKQESIEKLASHLLDEYEIKEILGLLYTSVPNDVPIISYKVGAEFKKLNELSVGQKAVALLIIALSDGNFPIIIDQPEDSLDLRSIWEDVCTKLRGTKDRRQFIFTTHNSSVAVASDSDKFTILQADANHGSILFSGSINRKEIKDNVIDYLEGGPDTYNQKKSKYNC